MTKQSRREDKTGADIASLRCSETKCSLSASPWWQPVMPGEQSESRHPGRLGLDSRLHGNDGAVVSACVLSARALGDSQ